MIWTMGLLAPLLIDDPMSLARIQTVLHEMPDEPVERIAEHLPHGPALDRLTAYLSDHSTSGGSGTGAKTDPINQALRDAVGERSADPHTRRLIAALILTHNPGKETAT